jgi:chemotaxis protein MotB
MARKKKKKKEVNKDAWLNTYADMITLVLVFFVLLYSMSSIDAGKYKLLVEIFNPAALEEPQGDMMPTVETDDATSSVEDIKLEEIVDLEDLYQYLSKYAKENGLEDSIEIVKGETAVQIKFMSTVFFEPDLAQIKPPGKKILGDIGTAIGYVEPTIKAIRIDGHTAVADSPINDRDLSSDRANEVLKFLENGYIADPSKLLAVGFGMYRPIAPNDTEENRAKNRRVEILVSEDETIENVLGTIDNNMETEE